MTSSETSKAPSIGMAKGEGDHTITFPALDLGLSELERHSITISGHRTSISIERGFWQELKKIAIVDDIPIAQLVRRLDEERSGSLSGALRSYVLQRLLSDLTHTDQG